MQKSEIAPAVVQIVGAKYLGKDTFSIDSYDSGLLYYNKNGKEIESVGSDFQSSPSTSEEEQGITKGNCEGMAMTSEGLTYYVSNVK